MGSPVAAPHQQPLAVWDSNVSGGLFWRNQPEASLWAQEHFPERARRTVRAEFYLMDVPYVVLTMLAEDSRGRPWLDEATGEAAQMPPLTLILTDLPPRHLLS
jgi:hypothetical protein